MLTATDVFAKTRDHDRLALLRQARDEDLLPYFRLVEGQAGPTALVEGAERLMFGSNNYLGLAHHPRVKKAAIEAVREYGTALGGRLLNGTTPLHVELERELAEWMGTDDALVFSTGYQANLGCLSALVGPGDTVISDSENHASIVDGVVLSGARLRPYRHGRLDRLDEQLGRAGADGSGILVVVDGVFSMRGDLCDLPAVSELCRRHGARLMVDEAHAVGVLGARGAGTAELLEVEEHVDLRMGSFGKALGSAGGFIAGPREVIDFLRVRSRAFMFTTSGVPAAVAAALAAVRICRSEEGRELFGRLRHNARYLREGLLDLGLPVLEASRLPDGREAVTPVVPVRVGDDGEALRVWRSLFDAGLFANLALHPAVRRGDALLRLSVRAAHGREHLDAALERLAGLGDALRSGQPGGAVTPIRLARRFGGTERPSYPRPIPERERPRLVS